MSLDVERPSPPSLDTEVDAAEYDDADVTGADDYRREELQSFLDDGAWADAWTDWTQTTQLTDHEFQIAQALGPLTDFDFFWDNITAYRIRPIPA